MDGLIVTDCSQNHADGPCGPPSGPSVRSPLCG